MFMTAFITVVAAYLIGSISFAVIFSKKFIKKDIRDIGSGNAGATNVFRSGGILPGLLTFLCDAAKGFCASGLGYLIFSYIFNNVKSPSFIYEPIFGAYICGLFCVIGHIFPLFFGFKGGKGVAVGVGIMLVCSPYAILIGLGVFAIILVLSKYVSLSSLVATAVTVAMSAVFTLLKDYSYPAVLILIAVLIGTIIFLKHSSNIRRLINGEENKINRR